MGQRNRNPELERSDRFFRRRFPRSLTYTVLSADGEALASGLTSTSWTTPVAEPADTYKAISYAVKSEYAGKQSAAVASNVIGLGAYSTPMTMALDGEAPTTTARPGFFTPERYVTAIIPAIRPTTGSSARL